ncbi:MAG: CPBP family intramembrane metalloprotease [Flavobacteriales bacterium]|nr:CPBP family intramembrane metalloprotease [Flavobacteriales bacterium]
MTRKSFFLLGIVTLIVFPLLGWPLLYFFQEKDITSIFNSDSPWFLELGIGLSYGLVTSIVAWQIIQINYLNDVRTFFSNLIQQFNLSIPEILFISFCAGFGEEILFRAEVQPLLGIWLTSIIFIAIHGYLNPKNKPLCVYGIYTCFVIAGIGYLYQSYGLISAIAAHFMIDVILLYQLGENVNER